MPAALSRAQSGFDDRSQPPPELASSILLQVFNSTSTAPPDDFGRGMHTYMLDCRTVGKKAEWQA